MIFAPSNVSCLARRLCVGAGMVALVAGAAQAQSFYAVDIPAGPLDAALLALAKQTDQQLFFPREAVAGRRAPALRGRYTPEQALAVLLGGTDLAARRTGPEVLVVQRRNGSPPATEANGPRPFPDGEVATSAGDPLVAAEATPAGAVRPAATTVEELHVTGTHIRGAPVASPLVVMDQELLARTGHATVADALRTLPANFGGGAAEGNSLTGADPVARNGAFGTGLNLRGLGNSATLVLVNGRRLAGSGSFGDFADVSSIPTAAVERVEVLLDGASAVYGSDAVGGVVNIITRKSLQGGELRLMGGVGTAGEPLQGQVSVTAGHRWDDGGFVLSYELQRRDALRAGDRAYSASSDLRPFGGSDFRLTNAFPGNVLVAGPGGTLQPTYAIPAGQSGVGLRPGDFVQGAVNRQNQRLGADLLPRQTLNAVYAAVDQAVGDRLTLQADARFSSRRYKARFPVAVSTFPVGRGNPYFVSPNGAATNQIAYSFAGELPNVVSFGNVESLALTGGGALRLPADWRGEAYAAYAQEITEIRGRNLVNSLILGEALGNSADRPETAFSAVRDGYFNPYSGIAGSNPQAVMAAIGSGATYSRTRSRTASLNVQADGALWDLPGGALKLAVGAQARRESLDREGWNLLSTAAPAPIAATDVSRDVLGAFAELRAPLFGEGNARPGLARLELSLAGRVEHYEGVGASAKPKVGVLWSPHADLQVRATFSQSFRAPALRELYDSAIFNPTLQPLGAGRILVLQLAGGNPDLDPETADSWTVGVDWRPSALPGFELSVTGFDVRFKNRIDRPVTASIANSLVDPRLSAFVRRISPAANADDLAYITALLQDPALSTTNGVFQPVEYGAVVDSRYVNTASLKVRGIDATASYGFGAWGGDIALSATGSYLLDYEQQLTPTADPIQRVNVANFPLRFQGRLTADWTRGRLGLGATVNYTGRYRDAAGARIGDAARLNLHARLGAPARGPLKDLALRLAVRNVLDADPPFYNNPIGLAYDPANADPIGRFVSLQLVRTW